MRYVRQLVGKVQNRFLKSLGFCSMPNPRGIGRFFRYIIALTSAQEAMASHKQQPPAIDFVVSVWLGDQLMAAHHACHISQVPAHSCDQLLLWNTQFVIAVLSASEPWIFKVKLDGAGKAIRLHDGKKSG